MILLIIAAVVIVALFIWYILTRNKNHKSGRPRIYNQKCPKCGSDKVYYAGYADRKECGKCGKIF